MQILIDIPEEIYKASQIIDVKYEDVVQIPLEVIANGTLIPNNTTNGDVIKAIFPNCDIEEHRTYVKIVDGDYLLPCAYLWWNAPYKRGGKE